MLEHLEQKEQVGLGEIEHVYFWRKKTTLNLLIEWTKAQERNMGASTIGVQHLKQGETSS